MPDSHASSNVLSVVLDSNVWIDILVFDDPHTRPIRAALENGALIALIDRRCLAELTYVLDYPQFARYAIDKTAALAIVERLTQRFETPLTEDGDGSAQNRKPLPQCKDRDDQKFLELAYAAGAAWLVSKDRAVLKLASRVARDFDFQIAEPAPFVNACAPGADESASA